jgi:hypothetical protein
VNKKATPIRSSCIIDLTGKKFGRLTILSLATKTEGEKSRGAKWNAVCDCGIQKVILGNSLKSGAVLSCGCLNREHVSKKMKKDITALKFAMLTVVAETYPLQRSASGSILWDCICKCGNKTTATIGDLSSGHKRSCGCLKHNSPLRIWKTRVEMIHAPVVGNSKLFSKIPACDNPTVVDKTINVSCKRCGKLFIPSRNQINNRIKAYAGKLRGEQNFYCSDKCKSECPIYGARSRSKGSSSEENNRNAAMVNSRRCKTKELKQLQCDRYGSSYCEKCGDTIDVELHHTVMISDNPKMASNPAGHMLLCYGCHLEIHNGCR